MSLDIDLGVYCDNGAEESFWAKVHSQNYTHNVVSMWKLAGVYEALYDSHGHKAGEFLEILKTGIEHMEACPATYEAMNPKNGWGDYRAALAWLRDWTRACQKHPKATIRVSS